MKGMRPLSVNLSSVLKRVSENNPGKVDKLFGSHLSLKGKMCTLCLYQNLKTESLDPSLGVWCPFVCFLCDSLEWEDKLIYIFFRKWKLYYYKKGLWPIKSLTQLKWSKSQTPICTHCLKNIHRFGFTAPNLRKIIKKAFQEGKEKTVYSRLLSVCTNIPSEINIYYMHSKKLFTYWMLPVYVEKFRCNKMHSVIPLSLFFLILKYCVNVILTLNSGGQQRVMFIISLCCDSTKPIMRACRCLQEHDNTSGVIIRYLFL